ncbi:carboxylesterase/lipase family protein [Nocardiopsis sp. FIRDI 009]|uniref:carboxylesterase/lipase family protein n=1 Tax=Nocardiopsis sp. FIRDI 009 TaxID=714197 RepID=UPI000E26B72E|nr:carboxylesterase family protein [Nocardiopsis sp. FIRDI 009]
MDDERIVTTEAGRVRGTPSPRSADGGVTVFRGLPYAAPPFGENRFAAPEPAAEWEGVRDCADFGPPAPQTPGMIGAHPWNPDTSLDCLTLNVWTGARPEKRAPVLVWFHGGAYIVGSSAEPIYDGTRLAERGLVVVSVNFRLGFEGYGHVPGRPDNRAMLDQIAALRWVRDNVAAFGGNPDNVTIAGESAGAGAVVCLMTSPPARGLFHRAIAHSVPADMVSRASALAVSEQVADAAGVPLDPEALAALPPERILAATDDVLSRRPGTLTCYAPVVGGADLPVAPHRAAAEGATRDVDLLIGHNAHEYRLFTGLGGAGTDDEAELAKAVARAGLPEGAVDDYRAIHPNASVAELYDEIMGDALFSRYTVRFAEAHAAGGGRSHVFRLAAETTVMEGRLGACHAFDLPFAFDTLEADLARFLLDDTVTDAHRSLSERFSGAWSAFASSGDPGWPRVTADATPVRVWDLVDDLHPDDVSPVRRLWADVSFDPR